MQLAWHDGDDDDDITPSNNVNFYHFCRTEGRGW